jgi:hypothetical protein
MQLCSESPNDCAVVACCALTREPRESVAAELCYSQRHGTLTRNLRAFLLKRNFVERSVPRRGQDKMTGICRFASYSKSISGHLALVLNGHVYDASHSGLPINIYRQSVRHNHITNYWSK